MITESGAPHTLLSSGRLDAVRVCVNGPTDKCLNLTHTPADSFSGTVDGLVPGSYVVGVEGLVKNEVDYFGRDSGVQVRSRVNTTASITNFVSFVPVMNPLPSSSSGKTFTVSFNRVAGADSFRVEASTSPLFASIDTSVSTTQSSVEVTARNYGQTYIQVRAIDPYRKPGRPSGSQSIQLKVIFDVDSVVPADGDPSVETGAVMLAHFNDGVDPTTLTASSVTIDTGGTILASGLLYDQSTRSVRVSAPLLPGGALYHMTVTNAVRDTAGRALAADRQWSFTTRRPASVSIHQGGDVPSMARGATGRLYVSHSEAGSGFHISTCDTNCTSAASWQTGTVDLNVRETSLAVDGAGRVHVAYHDNSTETLKYGTCNLNCTLTINWQTGTVDSYGSDIGQFPDLVVDDAGRLHVTYEDSHFTSMQYLKYATCPAGCTTAANWDTVTIDRVDTIIRLPYGVQYRSSVAVDRNGGLHVVYNDIANGDLKYATCASACTTSANWQMALVDQVGNAGLYPSIAIDTTGRLHVSYYSESTLKYATCPAGCTIPANWQTATVDQSVTVGSGAALAVGALGRLHVTYAGAATSSTLKYATCAASCIASSSWRSATLDLELSSIGSFSALVVDGAGRVHVSYFDAGNGGLRYIE